MKSVVGVLGLGYVGLPLATLSAIKGFKTVGYDVSDDRINELSKSKTHTSKSENLLDLKKAHQSGNLLLTSNFSDLSNCNIYIICVPTPIDNNKEPDLSHLLEATSQLAKVLKKKDIIIVESTVFPGTCEEHVEKQIFKNTGLDSKKDYVLAHCPERVNPGDDFWNSGNIPRVIGATTKEGNKKAAKFYSMLLGGEIIDVKDVKKEIKTKFKLDNEGNFHTKLIPPGSITLMETIRDAEAVKAMENTVRDVNIAFVNELAKISTALELDVVDIIDGMATKPFGKGPYYPGIGVGGHCIAVDPEWLKSASFRAGYFPEIINLARNTNNNMPEFAINSLQDACKKAGIETKNQNCLILGISYKKNIDDLRESPFFDVKRLAEKIFKKVDVYDPFFESLNSAPNLDDLITEANILILVTDHDFFVNYINKLNFQNTSIKVLLDGRNCIESDLLPDNLIYIGIGRTK